MLRLPLFACLIIIAPFSLAAKPAIISVMTFNIENGGTQIDFNKVVEAIRTSGADVVGLQEAWGNTKKLAKSLHWKYYSNGQHIVSRFPLVESVDAQHRYIYVEVTSNHVVAMANMHLPDEPYGPTLISNHINVAAILDNENKVRLPVALPFIKKIALLAKTGMPVFLTGDFNSPSDLDWTIKTVNVVRNHTAVVPWVVTKTAAAYGLKDSFRFIYPDPLKVSGFTWPSARPMLENSIDGYNPSNKDFPDRLDFIFYSGKARVLQSQVIGNSQKKSAKINISPWPSDHAAVVSTFEVTPMKLKTGAYIKHGNDTPHTTPTIFVTKKIFNSGEPIDISWKNAPGNRYDFIRIAHVNATKSFLDEAPRLYTQARTKGSVQYNASNIHGNWPEWNKSEIEYWPLSPGIYNVELVLDDSNKVITSTQITIANIVRQQL